ncbi:MAG: hypothetical protein F9B45_33425 [Phycisphaera sp. RhM]|nr:hypothetical protein [Phycisphaera sp. RhM]
MQQSLRQWLTERDEGAIDDAFFENECPHFFAVDWREDDADIVQYCADCLGNNAIRGEWRDGTLVIIRDGNETTVPLANDEGDRDVTIRTLNDALQPNYEIRLLVCSHGSDTAGFAVLASADWQSLDAELTQAANENFVKLALLPNIFTEMTDQHLPEVARTRFQRMLERNRKPQSPRPWWRFW